MSVPHERSTPFIDGVPHGPVQMGLPYITGVDCGPTVENTLPTSHKPWQREYTAYLPGSKLHTRTTQT